MTHPFQEHIYVMRFGGTQAFKIGRSAYPQSRAKQLAWAWGTQVDLIVAVPFRDARKEEEEAHWGLRDRNIRHLLAANQYRGRQGYTELFELSEEELTRLVELLVSRSENELKIYMEERRA